MTRTAAQLSFHDDTLHRDAVRAAAADTATDRGAVFTKPAVARLILNLVGYTADTDLSAARLLEPACGEGDFLIPAVERLLDSVAEHSRRDAEAALRDAVHAVEIHADSLATARERLEALLRSAGFSAAGAERLLDGWLHTADFLLHDPHQDAPRPFTHVVGNPPYVRQERIAPDLLAAYRARYATLFDRADLYVPFFERGLTLLAPGGRLGFICADRWMKNRYGSKLRALVDRSYHLDHYVDMTGTDAFDSEVDAYPAITVFRRGAADDDHQTERPTRAAYRPRVTDQHLAQLGRRLAGHRAAPDIEVLTRVTDGESPWLLHQPQQLRLLRALEARFPTLEGAGCRVGIGVATGADKLYIGPHDQLPVEPARKLRLSTTKDLKGGTLNWQGAGVVNPFEEDGQLADPGRYPRFAAWLNEHETTLRARNVGKRNPTRWYRTIDRITPSIAHQPKLLIPDIKGTAHVVYENDGLYPHHNLYYVVNDGTPDDWPLEPLGVVLRSAVTQMFMRSYSTPMRGGYLRFQAQYLRRLRLPQWENVAAADRRRLNQAVAGTSDAGNRAAAKLYGLSEAEMQRVSEVTITSP